MLSLRNSIFDVLYVIKRQSVVSLMTSLKFLSTQEYTLIYKCAKRNLFPCSTRAIINMQNSRRFYGPPGKINENDIM